MATSQDLVIKPQRNAYLGMAVFRSLLTLVIVGSIFAVISTIIIASGDPEAQFVIVIFGLLFLFLLLILVLVFINKIVAYGKESYTLSTDRIIIKRGGILSNSQTEMVYRNFTFVDYKLPFIEHGLFKTGELMIRSSGSSIKSDIALASLSDPMAVFEVVKTKMLENGFNLDQEKLVFDTYPDTIGIVLNIWRKNGGFFSILIFINIFVGFPLSAATRSMFPGLIVAFLSVILFVLAIVVRFLDLKKRHYQVFSGVVRYNKGFLTKHDAFIPVENISDSNTGQSFLQTIFGVYDIEISSKGVGTEIYFKNMKNGTAVEQAVDSIVLAYNQRHQTKSEPVKDQVVAAPKVLNRDEKLWTTTDYQTNLKMDPFGALLRFFLSSIGLIIGVGAFALAMFAGIREGGAGTFASSFIYIIIFGFSIAANLFNQFFKVFFTKYTVTPNTIKEEFKFLTTRNKEFNVQKVTGIVVLRDWLDRLIGTCSVKFVSIGSSEAITFKTIKYEPGLVQGIKSKFSFVDNEEPIDTIKANFNLKNMFSANLVGYTFLAVLLISISGVILFIAAVIKDSSPISGFFMISFPVILAIVFVANLIQYIYGVYYHKRSRLFLYKDRFVTVKGLINLSETYARFGNIKSLSATRYPFTKCGKLQINIAGELIPPQNTQTQYQQQQQANSAYLLNLGNKPFIEYVDDVFTIMDVIEEFQQHKVSAGKYDRSELIAGDQSTILLQAKSSMANGVLPYLLLVILFFPLLLGLPFVILQIYKRHYEIQQDRLLCFSGIINTNKTSILFARIDNINIREGFWNKIFKTSTIPVETIGSTKPEITVESIPDSQAFFDLLKSAYTKNA